MDKHIERDKKICAQFVAGSSLREIATDTELSPEWVRQILRHYGLYKKDRGVKTKPDRDEFLGVNLTEDVKGALRAEAFRYGVSMSEYASDAIREKLIKSGHQLEVA